MKEKELICVFMCREGKREDSGGWSGLGHGGADPHPPGLSLGRR